ncbi:Serum paraoxonase/arylesterase 2 [Holothuria leucospilota]|uniref:Paraoxonase n=1 Tax=Holothuria leucospilota TaxID=206669 RepID=A0A9Q1BLK6_HOLLE|nr:Serum paraoxonase/arylesterase 2 [Holothuria leucospilota]
MIFKAFGFLLLVFAIQRLWKISLKMGVYKKGFIHHPGPCRNVLPIETGSEDIALAANGIAFISSGLKVGRYCEPSCDPRISEYVGRIYKFDFNMPNEDAVAVNLPDELGEYFSPHGMDLWQDPDSGEIRLFVVNHRLEEEAVEILKYNQKSNSFSLVKSVRHELFTSVNDVVAVGPDSFYAANDAYITGCWRMMEAVLGLPWCTVVYYDGETAKIVEKGEGFNSLAISKGGRFVFLSVPFDQQVNIYKRDQKDGSLKLTRSIEVGCMIDNVFIDHTTGDVWSGCHLSSNLFGQHVADIDMKAPSQVIRVHPKGPADDPFSTYQLFSPFGDDGELVSASSSVALYKNKILIGTVLHKAAFCEIAMKASSTF